MGANKIGRQAERVYLFVQHFGRRLREIDADLNLSPARFSVLSALAFHGRAKVGELARFERVRLPSMTRLVRDMETAGLVTRRRDRGDRRGVIVSLTPRGLALLKSARQRKIALVRKHLVRKSASRWRALDAALESLEHLTRGESAAGKEKAKHEH